MRVRIGIDVDGPCAAMIEGFLEWFHSPRRDWANEGFQIDREQIKFHNDMGSSPELIEIDSRLRVRYPARGPDGGLGGAFLQFMRHPTVYSDYVRTTEGAQEAIRILSSRADCMFVTALMRRANQHVPDKLDWIGRNFPGIPISTVPSELKCWVHPDFAIDDRYDTCRRWDNEDCWHGVTSLLFQCPWSESPVGYVGYDWEEIVRIIEEELDERGH